MATRSAGTYVHGHHASVLASHGTRTAENSCGYVLDRLRPGQRVLDLGCGPGSITLDLAGRVGPDGRVTGVDAAEPAIAASREAADRRGDRVTAFVVGDLFSLDIEPASFDVVHAHQVLQHVLDPVGALRAMGRYCRPGGIVAVRDADYGAMAWYPEVDELARWRELYRSLARSTGGEPDAGRRLRAWVREAGLTVEFAGSSSWTYATAESTAWWGRSQADRVLNSSFADRAEAHGVTRAELERIADGWRRWGDDPDAWFFLPHGEVIARPGGAG
ncbi:methyltransferase domain-containing protein [Nigerium massiliense]|uniref:methyltransferase domain-containing protein n=1 Tax=Nigerium massiliense TaxID=1522317 RepID=UPI00058E346A|nr:methyltransferase domain-containing protein [Nigerium massiliense]